MWRFRTRARARRRARARVRDEHKPVSLTVVDAMVVVTLYAVMDARGFYDETMTEVAAERIASMVRKVRREQPKPLSELVHIEAGFIYHIHNETLQQALGLTVPDPTATDQLKAIYATCRGISIAELEQGSARQSTRMAKPRMAVPVHASTLPRGCLLVIDPPPWFSRWIARVANRRRRK